MKKIGFILAIGLVISSFVNVKAGYTPDEKDTQQLAAIKATLNSVSVEDLWNYYQQFTTLANKTNGYDEKLDYFLQNLNDYSLNQFSSQKNLSKQLSREGKATLVEELKGNLQTENEISDSCIGFYNLIDNLSYANNFPTALTLAVRWRESTCGYVLPKNGDGPFQIVSKDYGTGEMNEAIFKQTLQDFFNFSKNKIQRYNNANSKSGLSIGLSYTGGTVEDLMRFSALYNGLSGATVYGEIQPAQPKYFREGYKNSIRTGEVKKDGILATYIKSIKRELNQ